MLGEMDGGSSPLRSAVTGSKYLSIEGYEDHDGNPLEERGLLASSQNSLRSLSSLVPKSDIDELGKKKDRGDVWHRIAKTDTEDRHFSSHPGANNIAHGGKASIGTEISLPTDNTQCVSRTEHASEHEPTHGSQIPFKTTHSKFNTGSDSDEAPDMDGVFNISERNELLRNFLWDSEESNDEDQLIPRLLRLEHEFPPDDTAMPENPPSHDRSKNDIDLPRATHLGDHSDDDMEDLLSLMIEHTGLGPVHIFHQEIQSWLPHLAAYLRRYGKPSHVTSTLMLSSDDPRSPAPTAMIHCSERSLKRARKFLRRRLSSRHLKTMQDIGLKLVTKSVSTVGWSLVNGGGDELLNSDGDPQVSEDELPEPPPLVPPPSLERLGKEPPSPPVLSRSPDEESATVSAGSEDPKRYESGQHPFDYSRADGTQSQRHIPSGGWSSIMKQDIPVQTTSSNLASQYGSIGNFHADSQELDATNVPSDAKVRVAVPIVKGGSDVDLLVGAPGVPGPRSENNIIEDHTPESTDGTTKPMRQETAGKTVRAEAVRGYAENTREDLAAATQIDIMNWRDAILDIWHEYSGRTPTAPDFACFGIVLQMPESYVQDKLLSSLAPNVSNVDNLKLALDAPETAVLQYQIHSVKGPKVRQIFQFDWKRAIGNIWRKYSGRAPTFSDIACFMLVLEAPESYVQGILSDRTVLNIDYVSALLDRPETLSDGESPDLDDVEPRSILDHTETNSTRIVSGSEEKVSDAEYEDKSGISSSESSIAQLPAESENFVVWPNWAAVHTIIAEQFEAYLIERGITHRPKMSPMIVETNEKDAEYYLMILCDVTCHEITRKFFRRPAIVRLLLRGSNGREVQVLPTVGSCTPGDLKKRLTLSSQTFIPTEPEASRPPDTDESTHARVENQNVDTSQETKIVTDSTSVGVAETPIGVPIPGSDGLKVYHLAPGRRFIQKWHNIQPAVEARLNDIRYKRSIGSSDLSLILRVMVLGQSADTAQPRLVARCEPGLQAWLNKTFQEPNMIKLLDEDKYGPKMEVVVIPDPLTIDERGPHSDSSLDCPSISAGSDPASVHKIDMHHDEEENAFLTGEDEYHNRNVQVDTVEVQGRYDTFGTTHLPEEVFDQYPKTGNETTFEEHDDSDCASDISYGSDRSVESTRSSATEYSTASSYSAAQIETATRELLLMFLEPENLVLLYKTAIERPCIGAERLERNLRRLLKAYARDLRDEANKELERLAARLVLLKAAYVARSILRKYEVGPLLELTITPSLPVFEEEDGSTGDEEEDEEEEIEGYVNEDRFEDLYTFRKFLAGGEAFESFRRRLEAFVLPKSARVKADATENKHAPTPETTPNATTEVFPDHLEALTSRKSRPMEDCTAPEEVTIESRLPEILEPEPSLVGTELPALRGGYERVIVGQSALSRLFAAAGYLEPPLRPDRVRLRWDCTCGKPFWSDAVEYQAGGINEIIERVRECTGSNVTIDSYNGSSSNQKWNFGASAWRQKMSKCFSSGSSKPPPLPTHNSQNTGTATMTAPAPSATASSADTLHLLACVHETHERKSLLQESVDEVKNDRLLFQFMKQQLRQKRKKLRSMMSFRSVQGVFFLKVHLHAGNMVEIREHRSSCTTSQSCCCFPPDEKREPHPGAEYRCKPTIKAWPPVEPKFMLHMLNSPECVSDKGMSILNILPRRICGKLDEGLAEPAEGWGIYYQESLDASMIVNVLFGIFLLGSVLFGVLWSVLKMDIQGAFGVSSYMMTASGIVVAWIATKAKHFG